MKSSTSPVVGRTHRRWLWRRGPGDAADPRVPSMDAAEAEAAVRRSTGLVRPETVQRRLSPVTDPAGRVIARAVAAGLTDPAGAEIARRAGTSVRLRAVGDVGDLIEHVPTTESDAVPDGLRRELEEAAHVAHRARAAAERAAAEHAEALVRMEDAAKEQAAAARHEAVRRRAAEQLASESAEQVAAAHAERVRVEVEAKRQFELAAQAAQAHAAAERAAQESADRAAAACEARKAAEDAAAELGGRLAQAEQEAADLAWAKQAQLAEAEAAHAARTEAETAAVRATIEREKAEARAQHLAATLEATRTQLLEQTRATLAAQRALVAPTTPTVAAVSAPSPEPEPTRGPDADETVHFRTPSSSAVLTVLLGLGALLAAGFTIYQAYLDRLMETPGIVAAIVTLVLVVAVGRTRNDTMEVWLEQGVLHVENDEFHRKFDLATNDTLVQMVGQPGERRWKVLLLRKSRPTFKIDGSLVDPHEFVPVLRQWRPEL